MMKRNRQHLVVVFRKIALAALKIGIASGLIYWLYCQRRLDFASLIRIDSDGLSIGLLLLAAALVSGGLLLTAWRFQWLLECQRLTLSFSEALQLTLIGSFCGALLPGLVGGDAVKAIYLCRLYPDKRSEGLAVIAFDRIVGIYGLFWVGALATGCAWLLDAIPSVPMILGIAPGATVLMTGALVLAASDRWPQSNRLRALSAKMPRMIQDFLTVFWVSMRSPRLVFFAVGLSILNHGLVVFSFMVVATLLHDGLPLLTHFILSPLAMVMNVVPLTPGGIGVAESAFSWLFEHAGSPHGAMVGLIGRMVQYAVFALGGSIALCASNLHSFATLGSLRTGPEAIQKLTGEGTL
jgi:glycosyltransferase 2 family protein